jgi:hypothetical protein
MIGTAGTITLEGFDCVGVWGARFESCGGTAEEGVVGCVESVSEGAWDVAGVSGSDAAGTPVSAIVACSASSSCSRCRSGSTTRVVE